MELKLYERRSNDRLVTNGEVVRSRTEESTCMCCQEKDSVTTVGVLSINIHGLTDDKDQPMMEQHVLCGKCGEKWVDVFCRVYPSED